MKKLLLTVFLVAFATLLQAQWIHQSFDHCMRDTLLRYPATTTGLATGGGYLVMNDNTANPVQYEGDGALRVKWKIHSTESWGGYTQFQYFVPLKDSAYMDFSMAKEIRLYYYVVKPSTKPGLVNFRLELFDCGGTANYWVDQANHEDWYYEASGVYDSLPGWKELIIPLVDQGSGSPNANGFTLPGWSGTQNNGVMDFDKICGYTVVWTTPGLAGNDTAVGEVLFDKMVLTGTKYGTITTFDSAATNSFWEIDTMQWVGTTSAMGGTTLTNITDNPFEGYSSMKWDWKVNMSQSWGGYVNLIHNLPSGTYYPDLSSRAELVFFIKTLTPATGVPVGADTSKRVTLRLVMTDAGSATPEVWYLMTKYNPYAAINGWQMIRCPLFSQQGVGDPALLRQDGFVCPSWATGGVQNGLFELNKITSVKFELSGDANGPQNAVTSGSFVMDLLLPGGYQEADQTAPPAPTGVASVAGTFTNVITWNDITGLTGEKYSIYYSTRPITDVTATGVEVVKTDIARGVQLVEHLLRAPGTNQNVTYYYAVTCLKKNGKTGPAGTTASSITNMAKGVPTIKLFDQNWSGFQANGDLAEWTSAAVPKISIAQSQGTGFVAPNTVVTDDADCSADAYVAMDKDNLYVAIDVNDDIFSFVSTLSSYYNDCPDLFIGFYNWHGMPHGSLQRGATPDYHLRFAKDRILCDGPALDTLFLPGTANYYFDQKFPTGYMIEAKIPFVDLAKKRNVGNTAYDSVFVPVLGMRVPIDFSINDADATGTREGILCYSPYNQDLSYSSTARWLWTWIGNQWDPAGVDDKPMKAYEYKLSQNYPNPFNPATRIQFSIQNAGNVSLKIYNILGREVATLINNYLPAGEYTAQFNAKDFASGVYIYELMSGNFKNVRKMILMK